MVHHLRCPSTEHQYGAPSSYSPSSTADDPFQPATPLSSRPTPSSSNHDPISHRQLPITRLSILHPSRAIQHRPTADLPASDASFHPTQHPTPLPFIHLDHFQSSVVDLSTKPPPICIRSTDSQNPPYRRRPRPPTATPSLSCTARCSSSSVHTQISISDSHRSTANTQDASSLRSDG
ncbi:hypothetical protein ACLOJK_041018 [Asimina triloba]